MPDADRARAFAQDWIEAWNRHDLDRILAHYADDVEFSSPFVAIVADEPSGRLRGKDALAAYWRKALTLSPDLRFTLEQVTVGAHSLIVHYRRHDGSTAAEWLELDRDGRCTRSAAHYGG